MEKAFYNIRSMADAVDDSIKYIEDRKTGIVKSLKTRWNKFNNICMGGIEPNSIYTIGGISASGKSAFMNMIESDIIDLNPNEDIVILSFSFEMLSSRQVSRKLSKKLSRTTRSLYSIDNPIEDSDLQVIKNAAGALKKYPIYYVDEPLSVEGIEEVVKHFQDTIAKDKWLIVELDHTLLVDFMYPETEQSVLTRLQKVFIRAKKVGKTTIFQLSQMNREIEKTDRINNPLAHYPMRSDISTSDKVYQASDYVFVIHRPETIGIQYYGKHKIPTSNIIFLHTLKNREGELGIVTFENKLMYNDLVEL